MDELGTLGRLMVTVLRTLRLVSWQEQPDGRIVINNLTLINFVLFMFGPVHERVATQMLMAFQVLSTLLALFIRYPLANFFYTTKT